MPPFNRDQSPLNRFLCWGWDTEGVSHQQLRRVRTLTTACLLLILIGIPFIARAIQWQIPIRLLLLCSAMACGVLALVLLRAKYYQISVHLMAFGVFLGGLNQYVTVGGMQSGAIAWWMIVPLIGGLLLGLRAGLLWAVIALLSALVLYSFEISGVVFANLTPPEYRHFQLIIQLVGEFLALGVLMSAYLTQIETSERSLAQQNQSLQREVARAEQAEAEAVQAVQAKTRFLANMSHELRTPLNSILGFSQRLANQADQLGGRHKEALDHVVDNGNQMLNLVSDLLDLSQVDAQSLTISRAPVDLRETIHLIVVDLKKAAAKEGLEVVEQDWPQIIITGDVSRLKRALQTLSFHALQYCPSGTIEVGSTIDAQNNFILDLVCRDLYFSQQEQERIFDRYNHLHSLSDRKPMVSGLAMVLARELIQLHGGTMDVTSTPEQGTQYQVRVPVLHAAGPEAL